MKKKKVRSKKQKHIEIICSVVLALLVIVGFEQGYRLYEQNLISRDGEEHVFYVYPETTPAQLMEEVSEQYKIASPFCLRLHSKLMKWPGKQSFVKTGCYKVPVRLGDKEFISMFRSGRQTPVQLSFANVRTRAQLAGRLASQLMIDSTAIISRLEDSEYMSRFGLKKETAVCLFLPNTYEVWWNMSADDLFARMEREYKAFWTADRLALAKSLNLTPEGVATIASIVEEETNIEKDMPIIAGLYQNRLRIGMKLQACPTVKFALQDFTLRRILDSHLQTNSPYNTYMYAGLPPGPIRVAKAKTMDYVLHPVKSDYLYMCASTAFDGTHHFSSSYAQHAAYAKQYQAELNRRKIMK